MNRSSGPVGVWGSRFSSRTKEGLENEKSRSSITSSIINSKISSKISSSSSGSRRRRNRQQPQQEIQKQQENQHNVNDLLPCEFQKPKSPGQEESVTLPLVLASCRRAILLWSHSSLHITTHTSLHSQPHTLLHASLPSSL